LKSGAQLTGSEGSEYDLEENKPTPPPLIPNALLPDSQQIGFDLNTLLTADDFVLTSHAPKTNQVSIFTMLLLTVECLSILSKMTPTP